MLLPQILATKSVPSEVVYFRSCSVVEGVGLGVLGGRIDGCGLSLLFGRASELVRGVCKSLEVRGVSDAVG